METTKEVEKLKEYREKLSKLSEEEKKQRDLYLKKLADGSLQGPPTGFASIDKQWLQYYDDEAIISEIPKMTALQYLKINNKKNINKNAINFFGLKYSFKKLFKKIDETANALVSLGVKSNDIVVINSVTLPQTVFLFYALNKIGAIANLTDLRTDANGMKHYINEGKSKFIFTLDQCYPIIDKIKDETSLEKIILLNPKDEVPYIAKIISDKKENREKDPDEIKRIKIEKKKLSEEINSKSNLYDWNSFIKNGINNNKLVEERFEENKIAAIVHTSGTTSIPKSVALTNENFNSIALQYGVSDFKYTKNESLLNIIPMFVAYGVVNSLHMPLCLGIENILYPKVVNEDFTKIIRDFKPNHVIAIPMHWEYLLKDQKMKNFDLSFLKTAACGGDKLNVELEKKLNSFLKEHNAPNNIVKGYGMTEISACAVTNTNQNSKISSVGIPLVKNSVKIINTTTKDEIRGNEKGEILIKTPSLMKEYFNNEEATNKAIEIINGERWIHSGDIGHIEKDGNIYIDGRLKRLIIRRGFKVSAAAIEEVIMKNDMVEDCAVVKIPHKEDGEIPVAFIKIQANFFKNSAEIIDDILKKCKEDLPEYYFPSKILLIDEMPYTINGKMDFNKLEEMANYKINDCKKKTR